MPHGGFEIEVNAGDARPEAIGVIVAGLHHVLGGQERPEGSTQQMTLGVAPESLRCPIKYCEPMTDPCCTPCCGASFCRACLQEWLDRLQAMGERKACPWCKKDMPSAPAVNRALRAACLAAEAEARARGVDSDLEGVAA